MKPVRLCRLDAAIAAALAGAYLLVLVPTAHDLGFARDEGFYFQAADAYGRWLERLVDDPAAATTRDVVDHAWTTNHEHPPLMKTLFAISSRLFGDVFEEPSTSYRFPGMVAGAIVVWLLYLFGAQVYGRVTGVVAAAAFALAPRPFYHSHLACFDVAITAAWLAVVYAYWRGLASKGWGIAAGVLFGVALLTKHNAFFLLPTLGVHYLVQRFRDFRLARGDRGDFHGVPVSAVAALVLGPLLFVAFWPWLWNDTSARFVRYLEFHMNHPYYNIEYLGTTWFEPPFPHSYPFGMTAFTWPLTTLVLFAIGLVAIAPKLLPGPLRRRIAPAAVPDERRTDLLLVWAGVVPIAIFASGRVPIFGATKHWLPAMPFLCLFAGVGFARSLAALATLVRRAPRPLLAAGLAAVVFAGPFVETRASHPFALSHYTALAGGTAGAADIGLCRQFWGFTTGSLAPWLNRHVRRGGAVQLHDTLYQSYRMLQRDGRLREDIRYGRDASTSDYAIVHLEQHWSELEYAIWDDYGTAVPVFVLEHEGVPIVPVYERPEAERRR